MYTKFLMLTYLMDIINSVTITAIVYKLVPYFEV